MEKLQQFPFSLTLSSSLPIYCLFFASSRSSPLFFFYSFRIASRARHTCSRYFEMSVVVSNAAIYLQQTRSRAPRNDVKLSLQPARADKTLIACFCFFSLFLRISWFSHATRSFARKKKHLHFYCLQLVQCSFYIRIITEAAVDWSESIEVEHKAINRQAERQ